jgi:hypothetical protein
MSVDMVTGDSQSTQVPIGSRWRINKATDFWPSIYWGAEIIIVPAKSQDCTYYDYVDKKSVDIEHTCSRKTTDFLSGCTRLDGTISDKSNMIAPHIGSIWKYTSKQTYGNQPKFITFKVTSTPYLKPNINVKIVDVEILENSNYEDWYLKTLNMDHWLAPKKCTGMLSLELICPDLNSQPVIISNKPKSRFELINDNE